jgi:hypothetical protein
MNLKEIYELGIDVKDSQIPQEWKESFNSFIFGQTCQAELNEDGSVKDFIYYSHDFRFWYNQNKEAIERDIKIDEVCKKEDSYTNKN